MLEVTFYRDSGDRLSSLFADGHADFAEGGDDIVCASASTLLQAARLGLQAHAKVPLDLTQESGRMRMRWPESARTNPSVAAIVETARLSIAQLARQYPDHVALHERHEP